MKIIITGAHGTGKSTLVSGIKAIPKYLHFGIVPSARQKMLDLGLEHSENGSELTQEFYMEHCLSYQDNYNIICDRCPIDVLAYTFDLMERGKISHEFSFKQEYQVRNYLENSINDTHIFFLEPEFEIAEEEHLEGGIRSIDKEYQRNISDNIKYIMDFLKVPYTKISGCPTKRIMDVLNLLN